MKLAEYNEKQKEEILGDDNMSFAREKLGHHPSDDEAARHYIENGGADDYRKRNGYLLEV